MNSRRRTQGKRRIPPPEQTTILLVCEGETETAYFKGFRHRGSGVRIELRKAGKRDAEDIVAEAIKCTSDEYHQVWAVFDTENRDVTKARSKAKKFTDNCKDVVVRTAVSQPAFEVWLLLHHLDHDQLRSCRSARDAEQKLARLVPQWRKGKWDSRKRQGTRFADFRSGVDDACHRARELGPVGHNGDPATDVHEFVQEVRTRSRT